MLKMCLNDSIWHFPALFFIFSRILVENNKIKDFIIKFNNKPCIMVIKKKSYQSHDIFEHGIYMYIYIYFCILIVCININKNICI